MGERMRLQRRAVAFVVVGGCPGGEEAECVGAGGPGFGGVDDHDEAGVGGEFHGFELQVEVSDDGVMNLFHSGAVESYVVLGPFLPELIAAGGQFTDEVAEGLVVGVTSRFGA